MSKIQARFLREVQARGWEIESVGKDRCVGKCPLPGCGVRAMLRQGASIPPRLEDKPAEHIKVEDAEHGLRLLRQRRRELGLIIAEVEDCAGLTVDAVAKYESAKVPKIPNVDSFVLWAAALGYDVVLKPTRLPPITLSTIEGTRHLQGRRK